MKLGIGAAQFGLSYGISNRDGMTPEKEVSRILEVAADNGVHFIDTAPSYGISEEVLGRSIKKRHPFSIITKTQTFSTGSIGQKDSELLEKTFYQSLSKMNHTSIYGLLIHHVDNLLSKNGNILIKKMEELKESGLVAKIGVSVYTGEQIDQVLENYSIDLIQLPVNVLDQRLLASGHLSMLKKRGIEIHARSAFLQGLLLMDPEHLPPYFNSIRGHLRKFHRYVQQSGMSLIQVLLGFVMGLKEIDLVICGVNNLRQLQELCSSAKPVDFQEYQEFALNQSEILHPSMWKINAR